MSARPSRAARRSSTPLRTTLNRAASALLLGLWATAVHADPLTLDAALRLAEVRSRQLPAQDASASAFRQMAVAAGQRPDPLLKAGVNSLPINGPDRFSLTRDFMTDRSVSVMQELTRRSKLEARSARFEREAEVARASRDLALANLQRDTAIAWLDRLYQERMRQVLVSQRDETRLQIEGADAVYRGGLGTQADLFVARSAVARMEDRIAQADRQIATAKTQLARWVGAEAAADLGPPPALETVRMRAEDVETRLAHHPQIELMLRQEAVAQAQAEVARTDRHADFSVELMYSQRGPAFSNMISVNLSVPLQWDRKNRQDRELAARLAVVEQLRAEREEATRVVVAEALAMLQEWQSNRERLVRYDTSLLPLAGERTRAAIAAYRGGAAVLPAVLEARRAEIDTRIERLSLEMEAARLWARIEYLLPGRADALPAARP